MDESLIKLWKIICTSFGWSSVMKRTRKAFNSLFMFQKNVECPVSKFIRQVLLWAFPVGFILWDDKESYQHFELFLYSWPDLTNICRNCQQNTENLLIFVLSAEWKVKACWREWKLHVAIKACLGLRRSTRINFVRGIMVWCFLTDIRI